jgi:hypothetical protein
MPRDAPVTRVTRSDIGVVIYLLPLRNTKLRLFHRNEEHDIPDDVHDNVAERRAQQSFYVSAAIVHVREYAARIICVQERAS